MQPSFFLLLFKQNIGKQILTFLLLFPFLAMKLTKYYSENPRDFNLLRMLFDVEITGGDLDRI